MLLTSINFVNMTSRVRGLPFFFRLDETHEQHIGHFETTRQMLGHAFVLFLASQWGGFLLTLILYIYASCEKPNMAVHKCMLVLALTNCLYEKNLTRVS